MRIAELNHYLITDLPDIDGGIFPPSVDSRIAYWNFVPFESSNFGKPTCHCENILAKALGMSLLHQFTDSVAGSWFQPIGLFNLAWGIFFWPVGELREWRRTQAGMSGLGFEGTSFTKGSSGDSSEFEETHDIILTCL